MPKKLVNARTLAEALGISARRIGQLVAAGVRGGAFIRKQFEAVTVHGGQ